MSDKTMGEKYPDLQAMLDGRVSGRTTEWPLLREELRAFIASSKDTESQLRHDLLNEQAASRMAHEVVARNRVLEAENAPLRHALANAEVAAGFAKEMAEKVKAMQEEIDSLRREVAAAMQLGFVRGMERSAAIAWESCEDCSSEILAEAAKIQP